MEITDYPKSSNVLAVAGLALSVLAFIVALIPCLGTIALLPALIGLIFAIIGLAKSEHYHTPKSVAVVGIVMGTAALMMAGVWTGIISSFAHRSEHHLEQKIERIINRIDSKIKETEIVFELRDSLFTNDDMDEINRKAEKAGDLVESAVHELLKGLQSFDVVKENGRIIITIPKNELTEQELEQLRSELKQLDSSLRRKTQDVRIKLRMDDEN